MAHKKKHETPEVEKENSERWLLTYADMITLLLILFIVLYSMSVVSKKKVSELSQALTVAFSGSQKSLLEGTPGILDAFKQGSNKKTKETYVKTVSALQKEMGDKSMKVVMTEEGVKITMSSDFFFASGSADFAGNASGVLDKLVEVFKATNNKIRIEGHTDNQPIIAGTELSRRYPTNWELSSQRAINVLKYLERQGVPGQRLSGVALGETKPAKNNDSPEGRAANRRVEIYVLTEPVMAP